MRATIHTLPPSCCYIWNIADGSRMSYPTVQIVQSLQNHIMWQTSRERHCTISSILHVTTGTLRLLCCNIWYSMERPGGVNITWCTSCQRWYTSSHRQTHRRQLVHHFSSWAVTVGTVIKFSMECTSTCCTPVRYLTSNNQRLCSISHMCDGWYTKNVNNSSH